MATATLFDERVDQQAQHIRDNVLSQKQIHDDEVLAMAEFDVKLKAALPVIDDSYVDDRLRTELRSFWRTLGIDIDTQVTHVTDWIEFDTHSFSNIDNNRRAAVIVFLESLSFGPQKKIILHWYQEQKRFRLEQKLS